MPSNPRSPICCPTSEAYPKSQSNRLRTREYPPIDSCSGDVGQWIWKTSSPIYRRKVKKATELVANYKLATTGSDHLDRRDRDAVHRLLDTLTFDANRRLKSDGGAKSVLEGVGV